MKKNTLLFCFLASALLSNAQNDAPPPTQEVRNVEFELTPPPEDRILNNEVVKTSDANELDDNEVYTLVEQQPAFKEGGYEAVSKYIIEQLRYPEDARKKDIQGRVIITFIVEKDGSLSKIKILRGIDPNCDAEAIRVITSMPNWVPGKHNGKPKRVNMTIPIYFKLGK